MRVAGRVEIGDFVHVPRRLDVAAVREDHDRQVRIGIARDVTAEADPASAVMDPAHAAVLVDAPAEPIAGRLAVFEHVRRERLLERPCADEPFSGQRLVPEVQVAERREDAARADDAVQRVLVVQRKPFVRLVVTEHAPRHRGPGVIVHERVAHAERHEDPLADEIGEAHTGRAFDDLGQHVVAGIAVLVACARLEHWLRHRPEQLRGIRVARPSARRVDDVVILGKAAGVCQQMANRHSGVRRERGHIAADRVVVPELAVLGEPHDGHRRELLRDRVEPERGLDGQRNPTLEVRMPVRTLVNDAAVLHDEDVRAGLHPFAERFEQPIHFRGRVRRVVRIARSSGVRAGREQHDGKASSSRRTLHAATVVPMQRLARARPEMAHFVASCCWQLRNACYRLAPDRRRSRASLGGSMKGRIALGHGPVFGSSKLAAAVVAALYPAAAVVAQDRLEEIIVTATRRELNLQEVPQNVTAFTTADIEKQAFQDVMDVIAALPSVVLNQNQPGRNAIVMRGVSTGARDYRTDSQVSVYLDDQPLTSASLQVDINPIDIERIEVMPGPQGTLFGSSSQTGTMRYITNKPDPSALSSQVDFETATTKGGEASYSASGHVNLPVSDSLAVRLVGFYSFEGGYTDNVFGPMLGGYGGITNADVVENNWNDYESSGGRIQARWLVNPDWESTLSFITQSGHADGVWESDPALGDYNMTKFFDEYRDDSWWQASLNVKGDLGFAELSVTGSYADRKIKYEWDNSLYDLYRSYNAAYLANAGYVQYNLYNTGLELGTTYDKTKQQRYAFEVRLTSKGESRFQWMAGAFYEDVYDWWHYGSRIPNLTSTPSWEQAQYVACYGASLGYDVQCPLPETQMFYSDYFDRTIKQTALFGEMTFDLTDRWSVTGGARWFEYDRDGFDVYSTPEGLPLWNSGGARFAESRLESKGTDSDTVFKFATQYKFTPEIMAYALYSEGFRLGGTNSPRAANTGTVPYEYKPDKLHNYEVGLKSQWLDNRLQVNVDFFFMQWDDFQLRARAGEGQPFWVRGIFNGGQVEQKGVELNLSAQITQRFSIEGSAFLADPEFTETTYYPRYDPADPDPFFTIPAGSKLPISPDRKYFVSASYDFPQFFGTNGKAYARVSWSYNSELYNTIDGAIAEDPTDLIPSWSQTNLQLGYTHNSGWETRLMVRNLFDEKGINWLSTSTYGDDLPAFSDDRFHHLRTLQRPLTVSLSFSKKW
jgi:outer membrane receptor protein involved in Fe transport